MTTTNGWTVVDADAGVLTYDYKFPGGTANSFAARLKDGSLFVLSPPSDVPEEAFAQLAKFGDVSLVAVNNGFHYLGQAEWKKRFPDARFFAAPEAAKRIAKKSPATGEFEPISELDALLGDDVGITEASGTRYGETWAWAKTADGHAWYSSDVLANYSELPKPFMIRQAFKLSKSAPGFKVFHLAMLAIVKDKKGVLRQLAADVEAHPPTVIIPGHGSVLRRDGLGDETKRIIDEALG